MSEYLEVEVFESAGKLRGLGWAAEESGGRSAREKMARDFFFFFNLSCSKRKKGDT